MNTCPECEAALPIPADVLDGEIIRCGDCGTELEVLAVHPLTLGLAPAVEEDWGE